MTVTSFFKKTDFSWRYIFVITIILVLPSAIQIFFYINDHLDESTRTKPLPLDPSLKSLAIIEQKPYPQFEALLPNRRQEQPSAIDEGEKSEFYLVEQRVNDLGLSTQPTATDAAIRRQELPNKPVTIVSTESVNPSSVAPLGDLNSSVKVTKNLSDHSQDKDELGVINQLKNIDLTGLSPSMVMIIKNAITEKSPDGSPIATDQKPVKPTHSVTDLALTNRLSLNREQYQGKLPDLNFQTHNYVSDENKRWVKVNGKEFKKGEQISQSVKLVDIKPLYTVISFEGELIEVPALFHWKSN